MKKTFPITDGCGRIKKVGENRNVRRSLKIWQRESGTVKYFVFSLDKEITRVITYTIM